MLQLLLPRAYEQKDARIKVYVNEKNLGDYPTATKQHLMLRVNILKYLDADDIIYPHGLEIMAHTMEQFPEAGLGISQKVVEDVKPYPFVMQPKETFRREFLMRGVLGLGPTGTIIRRDVFEKLGGFTGTRYIGDTELWYNIALTYPVVKMEDDLIFWRQHDQQQIVMEQLDLNVIGLRYKHQLSTLKEVKKLFTLNEYQIALKKLKKGFARGLLRLIFINKKPKKAYQIMKATGFSYIKLLKAFG